MHTYDELDADSDTLESGRGVVARHHWLNTIVGTLDSALVLDDEEKVFVITKVNQLLIDLDIPKRLPHPSFLRADLALEVESGHFSASSQIAQSEMQPRRAPNDTDVVVSLDAWRNSLVGLFTSAYPTMEPSEKVHCDSQVTCILEALGVPGRLARFLPDDVQRAYRKLPEFKTWQ